MLLDVKNDICEVERILAEIREFCSANHVNDKKCFDILIIIDELATNVIKYAFPDGKEHKFNVLLEINKDGLLHIQIADGGIPFDPLAKAEPDTESSLEERQIGGLGIFFAKQLAEMIEYKRENDQNLLDILVNLQEVDNEY